MLLVAEWDDATSTVSSVKSASDALSAERFFSDLIDAVTTNSPVDQHMGVRDRLPEPEPPGGLPPVAAALIDDTVDPL